MKNAEREIEKTFFAVSAFISESAAKAVIEFYAFGEEHKNWNNLKAQYVRACDIEGIKQTKKGYLKFFVKYLKVNAITKRIHIAYDVYGENESIEIPVTKEIRTVARRMATELKITRMNQDKMKEAYQLGTLDSKKLAKLLKKVTTKNAYEKTIVRKEKKVIKILRKLELY